MNWSNPYPYANAVNCLFQILQRMGLPDTTATYEAQETMLQMWGCDIGT